MISTILISGSRAMPPGEALTQLHAQMDVARTAVRGASGGYPGGSSSSVAAVMKLAPNVDVEALQVSTVCCARQHRSCGAARGLAWDFALCLDARHRMHVLSCSHSFAFCSVHYSIRAWLQTGHPWRRRCPPTHLPGFSLVFDFLLYV